VAELQAIATAIDTPALRATASFLEGEVAAAAGDIDVARRRFEDAVDLFEACGAPFEMARSRLELASALVLSGRIEAAAAEAGTALHILQRLGAAREIERASALLGKLASGRDSAGLAPTTKLTTREREVLRLVAQGLGDKEIGAALGLSKHTAHRHIANILTKLDVPSRAAAVAQAAQHQLL
jgi:DNA-binding CsgD family transcriptional regulator